MSDSKRFYNLARNAYLSAIRLERAGRKADALKARKDALRFERLAQLAKLGTVVTVG